MQMLHLKCEICRPAICDGCFFAAQAHRRVIFAAYFGILLKVQGRAQTLIDRALQARRQHAGGLGQETTIESQNLGDVHHRVAGEPRRVRWQQNIAWGAGKFQVTGDRGHDDGLNAAAIERVRLNHKHRAPISGFGAPRLGKVRPPNLSRWSSPISTRLPS